MNNFFKTIVQLLLIWGAEMTFAWLFLNYVFSIPPDKFENLITYVSATRPDAELEALETDVISDSLVVNLNDSDSVSFPLFKTGVSEKQILEILGEPAEQKPGYWDNSIAWSYQNILSLDIDIGFLFDAHTQKLRQAEIAFPSDTELESLHSVLDAWLYFTPAHIEKKLESVYWRQTDHEEFEIDNLKAVIQRNEQDRIYIGVWESDFH